MDLVKFKREQDQHRHHVMRVRSMRACLDTSTPESLGLQHLKLRPKKQQLIEDRRQLVAKENAKLMMNMTKIMTENRQQPKHQRPPSLNEVERKREVDRHNFENRLMLHRLKTVPPTIMVTKLEEDFEKHLKAGATLRRRQMKPMSLTPSSKHIVEPSLFDSSSYMMHNSNTTKQILANGTPSSDAISGGDSFAFGDSPIKSMSEFRKHVISSKKLGNISDTKISLLSSSKSANNMFNPSEVSKQEFDLSAKNIANSSLIEFSHIPS